MKATNVKLSKLKNNTGQIAGLPKNPRILKDHKYQKLKQSIQDDPEMLNLREVIAYDNGGELVVICGNMRLRILQELGIQEVPTKILPQDTPLQKLKAYTIKDNVNYGDHDWDALANDWDASELDYYGVDVPKYDEPVDYSILDDASLDGKLDEMSDGVKKAIQIEFNAEHYEEAYELVKFWREQKLYIGGFLMEKLKDEKSKL